MRILFLAPANSTHTAKWVNALVKNGLDVHLVYNRGHEPTPKTIHSDVHLHMLKHSGTKAYYMNAIELRRYWQKIKPDIVNAHYASGYGTLVRVAKVTPVILSVWGSDVYSFPYESRLKNYILCKNLKYAKKVLSTSECMKKQVIRVCKDVNEIGVVPFGVDLQRFKKRREVEQQRGKIIIGCVKALEPIYGMQYLIQAIGELKRRELCLENQDNVYEIQCVIYGEGSLRAELEALIEQEGLKDTVQLRGRIPHEDVPTKLNEMDIFSVMSIEESFGVAVVEAQATSLPVVVSDAEGFCEVVERGETGFIVKRKSILDAADALECLVRDEVLRRKMGEAGRKRVEKLYDWDKNVALLLEEYQSVL